MAIAPRGDDPARMLNRRYLASFGFVSFLLLLNQLLVQPQLLALAIDPPTINRAGRQRMLSQRLAKAALTVVRARDDGERGRALDELGSVRTAWSASQEDLRSGPGVSDPSASWTQAIGDGLDEVEPSFRRLQDASARLIRACSTPGVDRDAAEAAVADLLRDEGTYLRGMERVVGLYEGDARSRVDRLLGTGRALTALSLVALAGLGLLVLRPASSIIRRQVDDLRRARDELEAKVRERTRELEEESGRRSIAEARHRAVLEIAGYAARISTLGEMASSLAHELNQPLGAIANYAEGCRVELDRETPDLDAVRGALRKLLANTLRAGEVVRRVRRFVNRRGLEREPFEAGRVLDEVAELMIDEADRRGIGLRVAAAPDLPRAWGDPVQVQQVLINLVRNAFEAVTAAQASTKTVVMGATSCGPGAVEFRVTDDGEGIDQDRLGRIFEPFFSTRAEGMGMGLAICRTMVEAHEGILAVDSEPGAGTTFRFTIPTVGAGDDDATHGLRR